MEKLVQDIFDCLPGCYLLLRPDAPRFTILDANDAYLKATKKDKTIVGQGLFEVFPDNPENPIPSGVKNLSASLMNVIRTKKKHQMPIQRYDVASDNSEDFELRFWKPVNIPVLNDAGEIACIIHSVEDVTRQSNVSRYLKKRYKDIQRQISDAVLTTQEMERMEISRELHDNIIQVLNTSRLYLGRALQKHPPDESLTHTGLDLVNKAIEELRKISIALLESTAEEEALTSIVEAMLQDVFSLKKINISKTIELPDESLIGPKIKLAVVRIVQEQLANVVKHSRASNLWISLSLKNGQLGMQIRDDGVGFDPEEKPRGLGLQNIRTRAAMLNGQVNILTAPGDGCLIEVTLPL